MPLTSRQIEKLNTVKNRIPIYGSFSEELFRIQREYTTGATSDNFQAGQNLKKFISDYEEEIKKMPLSSIRNDLGSNFYDYNTQVGILSATSLRQRTTLCDITPNRIIAGFVTSGTGVLTDKYANDTEIIFIEDETGSIGVIIENSLVRGYVNGGGNSKSFGTANSKPISNGGDQIGGNLPANDYRHNIRIGDMIVIQGGTYNPGVGFAYENPSNPVGSPIRSNQGVSVIQNVTDYLVDTELRGMSVIPYGFSRRDRISSLSLGYNWESMQSDNRLVTLSGEFQFVGDPPEYKQLSGENLIFLPNKEYLVRTDSLNAQINTYRGFGILKVVISETSELARFGVKIPTEKFRYITGIVMQDSESDERYLFPRFLGDLYEIDQQR
jgi:hypothetical protein